MAHRDQTESQISRQRPDIPHSEPGGGTVSLEAAMMLERSRVKRFFKLLGPGLVTGASDDDPSGIGTYAVAGAPLGFAKPWTAKTPEAPPTHRESTRPNSNYRRSPHAVLCF